MRESQIISKDVGRGRQQRWKCKNDLSYSNTIVANARNDRMRFINLMQIVEQSTFWQEYTFMDLSNGYTNNYPSVDLQFRFFYVIYINCQKELFCAIFLAYQHRKNH